MKLCYERCSVGMHDEPDARARAAGGQEELPPPARRCVDACVHKFADTAMLVSLESQRFQAQMMRQQQLESLGTKVLWGGGATAVVVGVGCCLLRGGDDEGPLGSGGHCGCR